MIGLVRLVIFGTSALISLSFFVLVQHFFGWVPIIVLLASVLIWGLSFDVIRWWTDSRAPSLWGNDQNDEY